MVTRSLAVALVLPFLGAAAADRPDTQPPALPRDLPRPALLIFTKANGYRHDSIPAATAALEAIARRKGWSAFATDDEAVFNPTQLARFQAVVWNNNTGSPLTPDQRAAFRRYVEQGGGFVGLHGAGGDRNNDWSWFVRELVGAPYLAHPSPPHAPQFQTARLKVEDRGHPASRDLPAAWTRTDEWYSFTRSPRGTVRVLISLDEGSYRPRGAGGEDLRMGDHPIVWQHCLGRGRAFFTAMGHRAEAYDEPAYRRLLEGAMSWALGLDGERCPPGTGTQPLPAGSPDAGRRRL
jgi:type 1 glutamine amidotransferase